MGIEIVAKAAAMVVGTLKTESRQLPRLRFVYYGSTVSSKAFSLSVISSILAQLQHDKRQESRR